MILYVQRERERKDMIVLVSLSEGTTKRWERKRE
jgi:hypothetical protein